MLALVKFTPFLGAVFICWIFSVCIHEFAHALVAYWGGDRSVRERGYLRLDPLAYIHPVTSILVPLAFLALGGIPLPGGAVRIDVSALRSKLWASLVSAAGPVANLLLFAGIVVVIHPRSGIIDPTAAVQPTWVRLLGAMAVLELMSVFFNLIPVPPLDGFGMIEPYLSYETRMRVARMGWMGLIVLYVVFFRLDAVMTGFMDLVDVVLQWCGLPFELTWRQYNIALFGHSA
ncbi:MAG: site-2 protease family protein [Phycisphaerae bacterium]